MKFLKNIDRKDVGSLLLDVGKIVLAGLVVDNLGKNEFDIVLLVWGMVVVFVVFLFGLFLKGGE